MPANLSPEYRKAEQAFRVSRDERERLACLKEMLRTIPKHKGTEHLQADIKRRIKQLAEELAGPKRGAVRAGPVHAVRPEGAAQVVLLGPPNAGKSTLHVRLTGSRADTGPYPYATHEPAPGMYPFEDIHFQLIDLPPISAEYFEPWLVNALQRANAALLIVDIADPECTEQLAIVRRRLEERGVTLTDGWPGRAAPAADGDPAPEPEAPDPFRLWLPALLMANKVDLGHSPDDLAVLKELTGAPFPAVAVSGLDGRGLDTLGRFLFDALGIVRVYTKTPGHSAAKDRPFTFRRGATVHDVARQVHKDIAGSLKYARAWGRAVYDGQQVGPEHPLEDGDIVELHMR